MKTCYRLLLLLLVLSVGPSYAVAADYEVVRIYPKEGQPMLVKNFKSGWSAQISAQWNKQTIRIPRKNIKSVKFIGIHPEDRQYQLEVEFTMKNGTKTVVQVEDGLTCKGETQFGTLIIQHEDMKMLDFFPDLSQPEPAAPAPTVPKGKTINPQN